MLIVALPLRPLVLTSSRMSMSWALRHLFVLRHRRGDYDYSARRADAESIAIDLSCHMTAVGIVGRV
jgi:hypothetical protein